MKFLKWLLAVLGILGLAAAGFFFFRSWVDVGRLMAAVNVNHAGYTSPWNMIAYATGLAALGGLLLGMAIGIPTRTAGSIRKEALARSELHHSRAHLAEEVDGGRGSAEGR